MKKQIGYIILAIFLFASARAESGTALIIDVFAGNDTSLCYGQNLILSDLNPSISGDVNDGIWFTTGDGIFMPSDSSSGIFSTTISYQPGLNDLTAGFFNLILVSDDPDGSGPMVEVSDMVTITFQNAPSLVCNNNISVALGGDCTQPVDVTMLLANPQMPYSRYTIEMYDEAGSLIPDNVLTGDHVGQQISFTVGHECGANTCNGWLTVADNIAPILSCSDITISCTQASDPDSIGIPIPFYAMAFSNGDGSYTVTNLDGCGDVILIYSDASLPYSCNSGLSEIITRTWTATDVHGNISICTQDISVEIATLNSVVLPPHYDNIEEPALECGSLYPTLADGNPDPIFTGFPNFNGCNQFEYTYSDMVFDKCGEGFKVLRQWFVIDWCTVEHIDYNQIIQILDTTAPEITCAADITIGTSGYDCESPEFALPLPISIVDCSSTITTITIQEQNGPATYSTYELNGEIYADNIPEGLYDVTYTVTDACANADTCVSVLEIIDNQAPFAICDEFTSISLGIDGIARLFATSADDGSFDNCQLVSMEIAKMTDECGHGLEFGPYADFCCSEVGTNVMVAFRVTDHNNNSNTCMVEVMIEEKLPPEIICPSDLTISCDYTYDLSDLSGFGTVAFNASDIQDIIIQDAYNNGVAGQDGLVTDNCGVQVSESVTSSINCAVGTISRTFTATDDYGQTAMCTQTITIQNPDLFEESDIQWPDDETYNGCDNLQADPSISGNPIFTNTYCAQVASDYEDLEFLIADSACVKIIRYWTVIDWCQFDADTGQGLWEHTQTIKLINTEAPVITSSCQDTLICSYSNSCLNGETILKLEAEDDCTPSDLLAYTWEIDLDQDGTSDISGTSDSLHKYLPFGVHDIYWRVEDKCGNSTTCTYAITVRDCKAPTPYCISSITSVLMPFSESLTIWAKDFDLGSFDNCTASDDLQISFSQDVSDTQRTFTCADIENGIAATQILEMWVTDEYGNQDYCTVTLVLQDSQDSCPDGLNDGRIEGSLMTEVGFLTKDVEVSLEGFVEGSSVTCLSNEDGEFVQEDLLNNIPYTIRPYLNKGFQKGVSTIDLAMIHRHILGLKKFKSPYQIIAADIDGSNKLSAADLISLRKFILGVVDTFPNNTSWRFVDESHVFTDTLNPWDFPDSLQIVPLKSVFDEAHFIAMKVGDVNSSVSNLGENPGSGSRSNRLILEGRERVEGNRKFIDLFSNNIKLLEGIQMSISGSEILNIESDYFDELHFMSINGSTNLLAYNFRSEEVDPTSTIISIEISQNENVYLELNHNLEAMLFADHTTSEFSLEMVDEQASLTDIPQLKIANNPSNGSFSIHYSSPSDDEITLNMVNIQGSSVYSERLNVISGFNEIPVSLDRFNLPSGVYFIQLGGITAKLILQTDQ